MNLLNEDNVVHVFLNKLGDIVIANLLFILCCIPVITIGPSLTALYHCMMRTVKGNNNGTTKTFFRAFKENFKQSLIIWLLILAAGTMIILNIRFLLHAEGSAAHMLFYLSVGVLTLLIIFTLYIFPVIATFANTLGALCRNAFLLAFSQTFGDIPLQEALDNHHECDEEHPVDVFGQRLLRAYYEHSAEVDDLIRDHLRNWTMERLPRVSLTVLRLALAEMLYGDERKPGVVINEAVELTKKYGADEDYQFVNGLLGAVAREQGLDTELVESEEQ